MRFRPHVTAAMLAGAMLVAGSALAADKVTFSTSFSAHLDCVSPVKLDDVPLTIKSVGVLNNDGTANMKMTMTAYYVITFKTEVAGKLGAPPKDLGNSGKGSLRVTGEDGLALILDYPNTRYVTNVTVDGKKCSAQLVPETKNSKRWYDIYTEDANFECVRFNVEKSSCQVR